MPHLLLLLLLTTALAPHLANAQTASLTYSYDAAGRLRSLTYPNGKVLTYHYDRAGNLLRRHVQLPVPGPTPVATAAGIVNAASFQSGPIAPGELITLYGTNIGPANLTLFTLPPTNLFPTLVGDTSILFDGVPAPIYYSSAGQTSVFVPYALAGRSSTQLVIVYQGRASAPLTVPVVAAAPALFSANQSGRGPGAILNQDASLNTTANPAAKGSIVILYGTGEGQTLPAGVDGQVALTVFPKPLLNASVSIGGQNAEVAYAGAAPGLVAGVFQINVKIPEDAPSGALPVVVRFGSFASPAGITVQVQ